MNRFIAIVLLIIVAAAPLQAHEIRPALLQITETTPGVYDVMWKVPKKGDLSLGIAPLLPAHLTAVTPSAVSHVPGAWVQRTTYRDEGAGLIGHTITIDGLSALQTDVLVRISLLNGDTHSTILKPGNPAFVVPERASKREVAVSYWQMGVIHILEGPDHLLFLLALLLIVHGFQRLIKTVTAFTVAHSITLVLAALGMVYMPTKPTEAIISLSIIFLAVEIIRARKGEEPITKRYPWVVAFAFGLFHGLGFAGALSNIGLPAHEVPMALFAFNVGVETGQVLFVSVVAGMIALLRRLPIPWPRGAWRLLPYTIGGLAAFWTIQRVASIFGVNA